MATKTAPTFDDLRSEARRNWQRWARDLASGKPMPPARELIDCGIVLGFAMPADKLETDAAVVKRFTALRADFDVTSASIASIESANAGLEAEIAKLQAKLDDLLSRRGSEIGMCYDRGAARRRMAELRREHPDLLAGEEVPQ